MTCDERKKYMRQWRDRHRRAYNAYARKWYQANKSRSKDIPGEGISPDEFKKYLIADDSSQ